MNVAWVVHSWPTGDVTVHELSLNYAEFTSCLCSYEIMKQCWVEDSGSRPSFAELEAHLDVILSKAQSENYIDLNVDEMLPYYSAMEQIDEVDDLQMKNNGYPDTSNITAQGFTADIMCSPSSNSDNGSITDAEVQNS